MRSEDNKMSDIETLEACCKLMAKIFSKQALNLNATNIDYKVENITDKETGTLFGTVKVNWVLQEDNQ
jgi:hypothetical protein